MKNLFDMGGKVAVVTGGAGLIGQSIVKGLAYHGATVYIAEIDLDRAESFKKSLESDGCDIYVISLDITDEASVNESINKIIFQEDRIDVWINDAYPRTKDWGLKLENVPASSWAANVDGHLNGYCMTCRNIAEVMKKQNRGSIINMASIYGVVGPDFSVYEGTEMTMPAAYAAIKGGIINFTRYLASYYGSFGVRVNCISPGGVFDGQDAAFVEKYCKRTPLGRMAVPEDMVGVVIFLASDSSSYMTGQNLVVDGGWTII